MAPPLRARLPRWPARPQEACSTLCQGMPLTPQGPTCQSEEAAWRGFSHWQFGRVVEGAGFRGQSVRAWARTPQLSFAMRIWPRRWQAPDGHLLAMPPRAPIVARAPSPPDRSGRKRRWAAQGQAVTKRCLAPMRGCSGDGHSGDAPFCNVGNLADSKTGRRDCATTSPTGRAAAGAACSKDHFDDMPRGNCCNALGRPHC